MSKSLSRLLFLLGLLSLALATVLLMISLPGGVTSQSGNTLQYAPGNLTLFVGSLVFFFVGFALDIVAWLGALVRTAQLRRWGWFGFLLVFSVLPMLLYIFVGPTTPVYPAYPPAYTVKGYQPSYSSANPLMTGYSQYSTSNAYRSQELTKM